MRWILLSLALASLVQAAEPLSSTVREQHYMVYGRTIDEIRRSIAERTPVRIVHGTFAASTRTRYQATYRLVPLTETSCALRDAAVKVESTVTLPQLAPGTLPEAIADEWRRYYTALRTHEYMHVGFGRESARTAQRWLAGMKLSGPCHQARPRVRAAIEAYIHQLDVRDQQLDATTGHGRTQGAWLDSQAR